MKSQGKDFVEWSFSAQSTCHETQAQGSLMPIIILFIFSEMLCPCKSTSGLLEPLATIVKLESMA